MYDTTQSKYIWGRSVSCPSSLSHYIDENLYRTPGGEYFTAFVGGEATRYATPEITPRSGENLRAWCAEHMKPGEMERLMPDLCRTPAVGGGIQISVTITPDTLAQLSALARSDAAPLLRCLGELIGQRIDSRNGCV